MKTPRQGLYSMIILGVSFLMVIGSIATALAETSSFVLPTEEIRNTNTAIPIATEPAPTSMPQATSPSATIITITNQSPTETPFSSETALSSLTPTSSPTSSWTPTNTLSPSTCSIPTGWVKYTVKAGDTLYALSVRYRTTVVELQAGNCMGSSTKIIVGTTLWVPNVATSTPSPTITKRVTKTPRPSPTNTESSTNQPTHTNTLAPSSTQTATQQPTPTNTPLPTTPLPTTSATDTPIPTPPPPGP